MYTIIENLLDSIFDSFLVVGVFLFFVWIAWGGDRDDRDDAEVDKLAEAGIFALGVRSVESLYYCSDAIQAVVRN